jgi:SNF2 family DNA or RNA helicase
MQPMVDVRLGKDGHAERVLLFGLSELEAKRIKAIPGAVPWDDKVTVNKAFTFQTDPFLVATFKEVLGGVDLTDNAYNWLMDADEKAQTSLLYAQDRGLTLGPQLSISWRRVLFDYQTQGVRWLMKKRRGILGDEMGLGKTLQALSAAHELYGSSTSAGRSLIVTVPLAQRSVWARAIEQTSGSHSVFICDGERDARIQTLRDFSADRGDFLIINHEMLQTRYWRQFQTIWSTHWDTVILDEAHKFQDPQSSQSEGAQKLKSQNLFLLTGTPVWNKPESIFGLLHLIDPHRWSSFWAFVAEFCSLAVSPHGHGYEILGIRPDKIEYLQKVLAPEVLQRRKSVVMPDLPEKRVQVIEYDLDKETRKAYTRLKKEFALYAPTGEMVKAEPSVGKMFSDLRALVNAPSLVGLPYAGAKTEVLSDLLAEALSEDRKVVVFTWHHDYTDYLSNLLTSRGVEHRVIMGGRTQKVREQALEEFQTDPNVKVLLAGIAATGIAIDLTCADIAIFAEGSYVAAHIDQAQSRLHRIGQKNLVMIYNLSARHTVESALWDTVADRQAQADEMLAFNAVITRTIEDDYE